MSMIRTVVGKLEKLQLPRERTAFAPLPRVRASCARASRVSNNCLHLFTQCAQPLDMECFAVKANCLVLRFTFLPDRCKSLSYSEIRWGNFYSFLRVLYSSGVLSWKQALCGEGRVKARVHVSFFAPLLAVLQEFPPPFGKGGKVRWRLAFTFFFTATIWFSIRFQTRWRVKAKNENSLMCAYTRAREENCGEVLPQQDLFSSIVLVFRAE